jgi:hypothetical protein
MICQSSRKVVKRFLRIINILTPGYATVSDPDIAWRQNPETLSFMSCLAVPPAGDKIKTLWLFERVSEP